MNVCSFTGRLTSTPSIKYESGKAVCKFYLAVKRNRTGDVDYIPCVVWGGYAESLANSLKKGQLIGVVSKVKTTNFTDDLSRKSVFFEFVVQTVEFLD